jgi:predicted phosphodiesterase
MSLRERLETVATDVELKEALKTQQFPTGWEPGFTYDPQKGGTITTGALTVPPTDAIWAELIADWGLDPAVTSVVAGSVQVRGWDTNVGAGEIKRMKHYKATLTPNLGELNRIDLETMYKEVSKIKRPAKVATGSYTLLVNLSDWQIGNCDFGGVEAQIEALARLGDDIVDRVKALRKQGYDIGCICIAGLGDLIENTCGFYSSQAFRVELDLREQRKTVRRALKDIIVKVTPHAEEIKVVCVPGNHGERRNEGKAFTRVGDNDDVSIFEEVYEILSSNPEAFSHIQWRIPSDEMAISVDLSGVRVAFTHGHAARGGAGNAAETMWKYWKDHTMGRRYAGLADAEILVAGHFHHFNVKQQTGRTVFVCPSLTMVSEYWADAKGETTAAGTLTVLIGPDGWEEIKIL